MAGFGVTVTARTVEGGGSPTMTVTPLDDVLRTEIDFLHRHAEVATRKV